MSQSLLLFAKEPRPGAVKTRLVPPLSPEEASSIATAFLIDLAARLVKLPHLDFAVALPCETDHEGVRLLLPFVKRWVSQGEGSLGDRLVRVVEEEFARGVSVVGVVGADHPNLPGVYLERCFLAAGRGRAGWVTTEDGGYAALVLPRLAPRIFEEVPWGTAEVAVVTRERAREIALALDDAGHWYDVDRAQDLVRLARDLELDPEVCPHTLALFRRWRLDFENRGILPRETNRERNAS